MEGGDAALVTALENGTWKDLADLDERDRQLCAVADKLSRTPTRMVQADWAPLRSLGFDDRACLEVAHIVGIFNHLTRLADGMGLVLDPETLRAAETGTGLTRVPPQSVRKRDPSGS